MEAQARKVAKFVWADGVWLPSFCFRGPMPRNLYLGEERRNDKLVPLAYAVYVRHAAYDAGAPVLAYAAADAITTFGYFETDNIVREIDALYREERDAATPQYIRLDDRSMPIDIATGSATLRPPTERT